MFQIPSSINNAGTFFVPKYHKSFAFGDWFYKFLCLFHFLNQFPFIIVKQKKKPRESKTTTNIHLKKSHTEKKETTTTKQHTAVWKTLNQLFNNHHISWKLFKNKVRKSFFNVFVMAFVLALTHTLICFKHTKFSLSISFDFVFIYTYIDTGPRLHVVVIVVVVVCYY